MAEIRIKKKSGPVWPWIIVLLFVAAAVWFVMEFIFTEGGFNFESRFKSKSNDSYLNDQHPEGQLEMTATERLDDFIAMVNDEMFIEENVDEEKARNGMQMLSGALAEVIEKQDIRDQEIIADNYVLSQQVNGSASSPSIADDNISNSFFTAANLIKNIQEVEFPELEKEAMEVQESAQAIMPSEAISDQGEQVKDFLIKTGNALESMRDGIYQKAYHHLPEETRLIFNK